MRRAFLVITVLAALVGVPSVALAGCMSDPTGPGCLPTPAPGTPPPPTPNPTPKATPGTPAPTHHYVPPVQNVSTPEPVASAAAGVSTTPEPTVQVPGPAFSNIQEKPFDTGKPSASVGTFIVGLLVGFLVGALVGRASWGLGRRRRKQQIFG